MEKDEKEGALSRRRNQKKSEKVGGGGEGVLGSWVGANTPKEGP